MLSQLASGLQTISAGSRRYASRSRLRSETDAYSPFGGMPDWFSLFHFLCRVFVSTFEVYKGAFLSLLSTNVTMLNVCFWFG
jgi:X-X-X-Leu-X-X-Gly heptad repeat protein